MFMRVLGRYDEAKQMFEKAAQLRSEDYILPTGSDLCAERQTTRGREILSQAKQGAFETAGFTLRWRHGEAFKIRERQLRNTTVCLCTVRKILAGQITFRIALATTASANELPG
jgi:hypothetical protein